MPARETDPVAVECLVTAGLPAKDVRDWLQAEPGETTDFPADRRKFSAYWQKGSRLLGRLPPKPAAQLRARVPRRAPFRIGRGRLARSFFAVTATPSTTR